MGRQNQECAEQRKACYEGKAKQEDWGPRQGCCLMLVPLVGWPQAQPALSGPWGQTMVSPQELLY